MPKLSVRLDFLADEDIDMIISEAEKLIATNRPRRSELNNHRRQTILDIQAIRHELNDYLMSSAIAASRAAANARNSTQGNSDAAGSAVPRPIQEDDDNSVILLNSDDDSAVAPSPSINGVVDLCTPPAHAIRRRRRDMEPDEIIEIDDTLPEPRIKTQKDNSVRKDPEPRSLQCPVCLDSPFGKYPTSTKCGHVFCNQCIIICLRTSKKCPICKRACNEKSLIPLYI